MEEKPNGSFADLTVAEFIEQLSSPAPVPGGGSASAVAGALGGALVTMVASLSEGRPRYAPYATTLATAKAAGESLAAEFLKLADRDSEAYAGYAAALKLPRETDEERDRRTAAIRAAARVAADAPMASVAACVRLAAAAESIAGRSNVNAASDVLVAALLAEAAARGAAENVRINLPSVGDDRYSEAMLHRLDATLHDVQELAARTREAVLSGRTRDPERA